MKLPLLVLALLSVCRGQDQDFCRGKPCPTYRVIKRNEDNNQNIVFEERLYESSLWITTKIEDRNVMAAHTKLKQAAANVDSWPVLISLKDGNYILSWFLNSTKGLSQFSDSVTLWEKPKGTVYVRVFGGIPSFENGQQNAKQLCDALHEAGKPHKDCETYIGAGYDPYISLSHHNEVWMDQ